MRKSTSRSEVKGQWNKVSTIGIDIGDRFSQCCGIDEHGEVLVERRVPTTAIGFEQEFKAVAPKTFAIETGTHSPWVSRLLRSFGHRVIVANSRKLRLIYENRKKDDRVDARYLARLARLDPQLLAEVRHRSESAQAHLELLRARDVLVAMRTRAVNHLRGAVKPFGVRLPRCTAAAAGSKVAPAIPQLLMPALAPLLETVKLLSEQIRAYDRQIDKLAATEYHNSELLRQITGVGALTALAFMLTVDDPGHFPHSRSVGAWLGLTPARDDSGQSRPQKRISKEGDHYLRRLVVGSAQYILGPFGPDCELRRFGWAIAARGGKNAKKRAAVAVARKLAVLLHRLWVSRALYDPLYNTNRRAAAAASVSSTNETYNENRNRHRKENSSSDHFEPSTPRPGDCGARLGSHELRNKRSSRRPALRLQRPAGRTSACTGAHQQQLYNECEWKPGHDVDTVALQANNNAAVRPPRRP